MTLHDTISAPAIHALGDYNHPSRSAKEIYGDDMLLMVWWKGNPWFVAAACCRVPEAMPWETFWAEVFVPYHEEDPDFDASKGWEQFDWFLAVNRTEEPVEVAAGKSLADLGLTHKAVLGFKNK
ncbi:MAG: phenol hydroxylase subunit P4 [Actinobacteria bacterium]|nr:phenol hydroxylase subunit P4 [Actinomycetota bacterium]